MYACIICTHACDIHIYDITCTIFTGLTTVPSCRSPRFELGRRILVMASSMAVAGSSMRYAATSSPLRPLNSN